jgi:hypothetical protein
LTLEEARRIGDLNIDLEEIEIIKFRRKVRDAVRRYDEAQKSYAALDNVHDVLIKSDWIGLQ